ncbi:MAG TPA: hypothetical protein VGL22_05670 [Terracidiphilus sp.]|jgi:hypothetical protein
MHRIFIALRRARLPILWIALANLLGITAGLVLVHAQYGPALAFRDRLVGRAVQSSSILKAQDRGFPVKAAFLDFAGNAGAAAVPTTIMGLSIVAPFPVSAARGFVGGVVSIDDNHHSRLADPGEAAYYLIVLFLQVIPYALAGGAGVRLGLGFVLPRSRWAYAGSRRWVGLPADGVLDVLHIYSLALPLFLVASLVEFLAR